MLLKILSKNDIVLLLDKPANLAISDISDLLLNQIPEQKDLGEEMRYGIVHRLDKDTSGLLLVAKTKEAFEFFQKQFKERKVQKTYTALVIGNVKKDKGVITSLLGRAPSDRRKQKTFLPGDPDAKGKREAETLYNVIKRFKDYTLLKVHPKTGRKHQIRVHLASIGHPLASDDMYGFKGQKNPEGLNRHFLHASSLKIPFPDGSIKEFNSKLPEDLKETLNKLL